MMRAWPALVAATLINASLTRAGPAVSVRGAVLSLYDMKSRSKIVLVGSMHYNPWSIQLARQTVEEEASSGRLRAVAVESCPTRWNSTLEAQPKGSFLRALCDNEMQSAAEAGEAAGCKTVALVDQTIEDTGKRVAQLFALTLVELLTPWKGGWNRIYDDFKSAFEQVGGEGLGTDAYLDARLMLGIPLSLVRYPLSIGIKSPLILALIGCIFLVANQELAAEDTIETVSLARACIRPSVRILTWFPHTRLLSLLQLAGALAFSAVETIVLGRVLLVGLLEERN